MKKRQSEKDGSPEAPRSPFRLHASTYVAAVLLAIVVALVPGSLAEALAARTSPPLSSSTEPFCCPSCQLIGASYLTAMERQDE
jgi:hypothetical protein